MKDKIGVLFVGGGFMARAHEEALPKNTELVGGVFSHDPEKSFKKGDELGVRGYSNLGQMLIQETEKMEPRIVSILTPNADHRNQILMTIDMFAERNIPLAIMCEKPMCIDSSEAEEIVNSVERHQTPFVLTHTYSQLPMMLLARDLVAQGIIGKVRDVEVKYLQGWMESPDMTSENTWRLNFGRAGPSCVLGDLGTHAFYALEQVLPNHKVNRLSAILNRIHGRSLENYATVSMELEDSDEINVPAVVTVSNISAGYLNDLSISVRGTIGSLEYGLNDSEHLVVKNSRGPDHVYSRDPNKGVLSDAAKEADWLPGHHPG